MPTLTFYADDETATKLSQILESIEIEQDRTFSRGDFLVPYIKREYRKRFQTKIKRTASAAVIPMSAGGNQ